MQVLHKRKVLIDTITKMNKFFLDLCKKKKKKKMQQCGKKREIEWIKFPEMVIEASRYLITYAKEVMFSPGLVCEFVCLWTR